MKRWQIIFVSILLLAVMPDAMAQCAMCRGTVESNMSNGRSLVAGQLNIGILYLLTIPYLLVAGVAYLWYGNCRAVLNQRLAIAKRVRQALS